MRTRFKQMSSVKIVTAAVGGMKEIAHLAVTADLTHVQAGGGDDHRQLQAITRLAASRWSEILEKFGDWLGALPPKPTNPASPPLP